MSARRLVLKFRRPSKGKVDGEEYEEMSLGPAGATPALIVVRSGTAVRCGAIAEALSVGPQAGRLAGTPIVALPPGAEFELWEVES